MNWAKSYEPIMIDFTSDKWGRVYIKADILKSDLLSFDEIEFKLDTASDFVTLSMTDLYKLGYTDEHLRTCPTHGIVTTADGKEIVLQYLTNISIKFEDREFQQVKVYFAIGTKMRTLFGNNILKYFNLTIDRDKGFVALNRRTTEPTLSAGELPLQIYSLQGKNQP
ncbi:MAG: retroviral-like aspartic protease family protein [Turicibacter sp.]|nr:retroviral-like aspartic protease family protein [Turicibacter sp.]